jgi:hypothetical protein
MQRRLLSVASGGTTGARERSAGVWILIVCAVIELVMFWWLVGQGRGGFNAFVWTPDTPGYLQVAQPLARDLVLVGSHRTLGYPVIYALADRISAGHGQFAIVLLQLAVHLGFTWGCWILLRRLAPDTAIGWRVFATLLFFWAGLGMALLLMTDFLAAAFFAAFLYGMLFWRSRPGMILAGSCLALATLTRPAFTLIPVLLPAFAYLIGRVTTRVPTLHLLVFAAFSVSATGTSVAYQYAYNGYLGVSPILILPIRETIYYGIRNGEDSEREYAAFKKQFEQHIEARAGRPYATLSLGEQERFARAIFREEAAAHPGPVVATFVRNFLKYMFVPVESLVMRIRSRVTSTAERDQAYLGYIRPALALGYLPVWLLSLIPPISATRSRMMYYLLVWTCIICVVGPAAMTTGSGERIRFSVLAFMLPVMAWNADSLHRRMRARIERWRQTSGRRRQAGRADPLGRRA